MTTSGSFKFKISVENSGKTIESNEATLTIDPAGGSSTGPAITIGRQKTPYPVEGGTTPAAFEVTLKNIESVSSVVLAWTWGSSVPTPSAIIKEGILTLTWRNEAGAAGSAPAKGDYAFTISAYCVISSGEENTGAVIQASGSIKVLAEGDEEEPYVAIGEQENDVLAGKTGTVNFGVTITNIDEPGTPVFAWLDDPAPEAVPAPGLTASESGDYTHTLALAFTSAPAYKGTGYKFKITVNGTASNEAVLMVTGSQTLAPDFSGGSIFEKHTDSATSAAVTLNKEYASASIYDSEEAAKAGTPVSTRAGVSLDGNTLTIRGLEEVNEGSLIAGAYWLTFTAVLGGTTLDPSEPVAITVVPYTPVKLVRAEVLTATPNIVRVTFNRSVSVAAAQLSQISVTGTQVMSTFKTYDKTAGVLLDITDNIDGRTVSSASPVEGTGNAQWDLTLSSAAKFGEILRLKTSGADVFTTPYGEPISSAVSGLVIKSVLPRDVGRPQGSGAGFYKGDEFIALDGITTTEEAVSAADLMIKAMTYLNTSATYAKAGDVYTIVLGVNQTGYTGVDLPSGAEISTGHAEIIVTTSGTSDITVSVVNYTGLRRGITLILDEHVVFDGSGSTPAHPPFILNTGARLILNGAVIQNSTINANNTSGSAGAIKFNSDGSFLLINSGRIINNSVTHSVSGAHGLAGAIVLRQAGIFVMHDGEISGNTATQTGTTASSAMAGAIGQAIAGSQGGGNYGVYITGGTIRNNQAVCTTATSAVAATGGVMFIGAFQKTGGTLYGPDDAVNANKVSDETTLSGAVKGGAVVIVKEVATNPGTDKVTTRYNTSGPDDILILDHTAANSNSGLGTYSSALWAESVWD